MEPSSGARDSGERPPTQDEQHVGSVFMGDRGGAMYTPGGREPVTYPRSGLWITVGIVVILFVIFFGAILLWH